LEHVATAKTALSIFPEHPSRGILLDIADYVLCRKT
jgi:octaprenyl-diphosphate synthase